MRKINPLSPTNGHKRRKSCERAGKSQVLLLSRKKSWWARDCILALHTKAPVVIQHISSRSSVALVRLAKQLGADIHAEATPHHFTLTEEAVLTYGTLAKMNPPLRLRRRPSGDYRRTQGRHHRSDRHRPRGLTAQKRNPDLSQKRPAGSSVLETALALGVDFAGKTRTPDPYGNCWKK